MIPPSAIRKYLDRQLADHRDLKKLDHQQIDTLLDCLPETPYFWHDLKLHQKVCLYLGIKYTDFAFWCDMGSGKTLIALELLNHWYSLEKVRRALVFVTSDKAFSTWERQIEQYKINVPYISLDANSSAEKWKLLHRFGDGIILTHYPGTIAMVSEKIRIKGKNRLVLDPAKLDDLLHRVDALVMDESTKVGNSHSLTYELCEEAANRASFHYALAGMPFGRDPILLHPQMKLVDGGETLGTTLGLFREAFYSKKKNPFARNKHVYDYTFKKALQPQLSRMLQHRSITYRAEECIELPEITHITERVRLPAEIRQFYEKLVRDLIAGKGGDMRLVKNAFLRMRQLSSGFLGLKDDETGDKAEMDFDENPKLERLVELVDELPAGRKALVFYEYTHSGRIITERLETEFGRKPVWLWSGTKNSRAAIERFIVDPACQIAVVNNRVGAYSLDGLQVANYEFFYESPVSVIDRAQAEKRIDRQGQTRKCFIYDLVAEDTVDEKILDFHREGKDLFKMLLTNPQSVLGV